MRRVLLISAFVLGGCSANDIAPTSPQYGTGSLGNGGFAFTCDDSVVCGPYNSAATFPDTVALGSKFRIRYVPKDANVSSFDGPNTAIGITVGGVGSDYIVSAGNDSLVAQKEGWGTIVARDSTGSIVEFKPLAIRRPDTLVVYDAQSSAAVSLTTITLSTGETRTLRALARAQGHDLAGALTYQWDASPSGIAALSTDATGKVTVTGQAVGRGTLVATGGTFSAAIVLEVK